MPKIKNVKAREVLDSRGNPTIEVEVSTNHFKSSTIVPSGASKGKYESYELRDGGKRYFGLGVKKAVNNVNTILRKKLIGREITNQSEIDNLMIKLDGTKNKRIIGANAILGVSLACARTASICQDLHLYEYIGHISKNRRYLIPAPFMNVVNGGMHAGNSLAFQEYLIIPHEKNFSESLRIGSETYHELKKIISIKYGKSAVNVGDEGGFAPNISDIREPLNLIQKALNNLGYEKCVSLGLDIAASSFYKKIRGKDSYFVNRKHYSKDALLNLYQQLIKDFSIISIEDPFEETKFHDFADFMNRNKEVMIVGDDLLVTSIERIKKAINLKSCNCLLLKLNQIGTLTEAIEAGRLAVENDWSVIISHRSGETEDTFISDFAVGLGFGQIKTGAPSRGERTCKYNRLLRIEDELGKKAKFQKIPFMKKK